MARILKPETLTQLHRRIQACDACPRLRKYCLAVAETKRRAYLNENYWGKPIAGFGDPAARLFIVGLAPAAHGANRTGRIFTGDRSGDWLYRALHKAGFANQPASVSADDGLELHDAYVSCVVKCAPPDNKPAPRELERCSDWLKAEFGAMPQTRVWLALGGIALQGLWPLLHPRAPGVRPPPRPKFGHGKRIELEGGRGWLLLSYHPSQQNTFTGRLTEPMFDSVFKQARELLS
jgi:uracil-DNA glycosylase family 4